MLQSYGQPYRSSSPECFDDETTVELESESIIEISAQSQQGELFKYIARIDCITNIN